MIVILFRVIDLKLMIILISVCFASKSNRFASIGRIYNHSNTIAFFLKNDIMNMFDCS